LDYSWWIGYCQAIFSSDFKHPDAAGRNKHYGGLNITGKNVFFFTASEDPWKYAGMR